MSYTVFYSWQKDLPNATNMSFIEKALERAIDLLSLDEEISLDVNLDRDTQNVAGTPDIVQAIFAKIEGATIFVADVSPVASVASKGVPNPNVLVELGYAAAHLGWDRIICVSNRAFGGHDDLPFDLRTRRVLFYEADPEAEKAEARKELAKALANAIRSVLTKAEAGRPSLAIKHSGGSSGRFGIENNGPHPIEVLQVTVEYPQAARLENWRPMPSQPVYTVQEFAREDGTPMYRLGYVKTDAYCHDRPGIERLPPLIAPGDTFWCQALTVGFGTQAPGDTPVKVRVMTREAGTIEMMFNLAELLDAPRNFR